MGVCVMASLFGAFACGDGESSPVEPTVSAGDATPSTLPTTSVNVCEPNPDPATPEQVRIDQPKAGETLSYPATISATVVGSENRFRVSIVDAAGTTIAASTFSNEELGSPRSFSASLNFNIEDTVACVWAFELTADDKPVHVAQVPVGLPPP